MIKIHFVTQIPDLGCSQMQCLCIEGRPYLLRKDQPCHKDKQIFLKGPVPFFVGGGNTQIRDGERLGILRLILKHSVVHWTEQSFIVVR